MIPKAATVCWEVSVSGPIRNAYEFASRNHTNTATNLPAVHCRKSGFLLHNQSAVCAGPLRDKNKQRAVHSYPHRDMR